MPDTAAAVQRQWEILRFVPKGPREIATAELHNRVTRLGYRVSKRTIERDLLTLEGLFPLLCRVDGRSHFWSWDRNAAITQLPGMSPSTALVLLLARDYLQTLLPTAVLADLEPYFTRAEEVLNASQFSQWREQVALIQRGPALLAPSIDTAVREAVFSALLHRTKLETDYRARSSEDWAHFTLGPLGLVAREGVLYLVATAWEYEDVRHYALHRMRDAFALEDVAERGDRFDLSTYLASEHGFSYSVSAKPIHLHARFYSGAGRHLLERPLVADQEVLMRRDGSMLLKARVPDTSELRWWILGFGDQVEVLKPKHLREEMQQITVSLAEIYGVI